MNKDKFVEYKSMLARWIEASSEDESLYEFVKAMIHTFCAFIVFSEGVMGQKDFEKKAFAEMEEYLAWLRTKAGPAVELGKAELRKSKT
jgi:hypothetical protein